MDLFFSHHLLVLVIDNGLIIGGIKNVAEGF